MKPEKDWGELPSDNKRWVKRGLAVVLLAGTLFWGVSLLEGTRLHIGWEVFKSFLSPSDWEAYHIAVAERDAGNPNWVRNHVKATTGRDLEDIKREGKLKEKAKQEEYEKTLVDRFIYLKIGNASFKIYGRYAPDAPLERKVPWLSTRIIMPDGTPYPDDPNNQFGDISCPNPMMHSAPCYFARVVSAEPLYRDHENVLRLEHDQSKFTEPRNYGTIPWLQNKSRYLQKSIYGLQAYIPTPLQESTEMASVRTYYIGQTQQGHDVYMYCHESGRVPPNPYCVADVFYAHDLMVFRLQFSAKNLADWMSISDAALRLVNSWRVKTDNRK